MAIGYQLIFNPWKVAIARGDFEKATGYMILNASEFLVTDVVVMGIVVIGVIALLSDLLMRYMEFKLVPWKGKV